MLSRNKTAHTSLDTRLAAYATLAGIALTGAAVTTSEATVIYSGPINIAVPEDLNGVYINFVTGVSGVTGAAVPGYDFNPYDNNAGLGFFGPVAAGVGTFSTGTATSSPAIRLTLGSLIGPAGLYNNGQAPGTQFFTGGQAYVGLSFLNEATGVTNYGWVLVNTANAPAPNGGLPATILGYGYENNGSAITAGAGSIPEPTTTALLGVMAAGALGVREWRRRKAA